MPSDMASSRKPGFPEAADREDTPRRAEQTTRPAIADFRPFIRNSEIWIKEFTIRSGRLRCAMLNYQQHG
jgi:hypothetical protein